MKEADFDFDDVAVVGVVSVVAAIQYSDPHFHCDLEYCYFIIVIIVIFCRKQSVINREIHCSLLVVVQTLDPCACSIVHNTRLLALAEFE